MCNGGIRGLILGNSIDNKYCKLPEWWHEQTHMMGGDLAGRFVLKDESVNCYR
jgi:hypothetical protein